MGRFFTIVFHAQCFAVLFACAWSMLLGAISFGAGHPWVSACSNMYCPLCIMLVEDNPVFITVISPKTAEFGSLTHSVSASLEEKNGSQTRAHA